MDTQDSGKLKVLFISGNLFYNAMVIEAVLKSPDFSVSGIVVGDFIYPRKSLFSGAWLVIKKAGWYFFIFKVFETLALKVLVIFKGKKSKIHLISKFHKLYGVPIIYSKDISEKKAVDFMNRNRPDVIVSMIPQKIHENIMRIPDKGIINLHPGLLPEYRAFGGYFWPLADGFGKYGYTIHFINEVIDGGDIILREEFPITQGSTVLALYYNSFQFGAEGLKKVLKQFSLNEVKSWPQDISRHPCRPWPNRKAVQKLHRKGYSLFKISDLIKIYENDL